MRLPQSYQTADDLHKVQHALMQWTQQAGDCNYCHKGDVRHRLFNGGREYNPSDILHYWVDDNNEIIGFVNLYPHWKWIDIHIAPDLRFTDFHNEAFHWAEGEIVAFGKRVDKPLKEIAVETFGCDPRYEEFVMARGYTNSKHAITLTEHDLLTLPDATLPEGFHFYDATTEDFDNLADVHNHSFTNKWTAESYGKVFSAPLMEYEIVVVAPDGRFASFTQVWIDEINKSILFEPMGTHREFQRRGIGKALMVYVLKRMQIEHDIERAYVCHEPPDENPASGALYASVGFRPKYQIYDRSKKLA